MSVARKGVESFMRWRFADLKNAVEAKQYHALMAKIDAWWQEFASKTDLLRAQFKREAQWNLPEWMHNHLQAIHPQLMWEYGPAVLGNGHRLVITPESRHDLRPLTTTILDRAPKLDGWEFYGHRLPEDMELTKQTVEVRVDNYDISDFQVRVRQGSHHRVDLCYFSPHVSGEHDQLALHAAFVMTETLLGEEYLDRWIGAIEVKPLAKAVGVARLFRKIPLEQRNLLPLDRMRETVDALIGSIRDQLPREPHLQWPEDAPWTGWKLSPSPSDAYIGQTDLFVGRSLNPALWSAAHSRDLFYSDRFSRCGETFCYIKLDGSERLDEEDFADKGEMEDALDAVLKPMKLGCHIGGGTGKRYSYIDLALLDVERGIDVVRKRLREGKVPKRSWIQFFDADLAAEWVGVYDDSPPPPMPDFEE